MRFKTPILIAVVVVLVLVLVLIRALAPWGIERYANHRLAGLDHYRGRIRNVDLHVFGGALVIHRFVIDKRNASRSGADSRSGPVHFVAAQRIEIDLRWGRLLHGSSVADISVFAPTVALIRDDDPEKRQLGQDIHWGRMMDGLPFRLGDLEAKGGTVSLRGVGQSGRCSAHSAAALTR